MLMSLETKGNLSDSIYSALTLMIEIIAGLEERKCGINLFFFLIVAFYLGRMSVCCQGGMTANCKDDLDLTLLKQRNSKTQI